MRFNLCAKYINTSATKFFRCCSPRRTVFTWGANIWHEGTCKILTQKSKTCCVQRVRTK